MSVENNINDLTNRRSLIELGGGEAAVKKLHADNRLTARESINLLLDPNTFVEIGAFVRQRATNFNLSQLDAPADGVVTGYGSVNGRLVYVYSQDSTVIGGSLGEMHAKKIANIYDMAIKMGAPIVALLDSNGLRLQEATDALHGFGNIFLKQSLASGVIPQITAVLGNCGGGAAIIPSLSDFTFMTTKNSKLYANSPNALEDKNASFDKYASAIFHAENTGIVDCICDSDSECIGAIRLFIDLLPSNNAEEVPTYEAMDDLNREVSQLEAIYEGGLDARTFIATIADAYDLFEVKAAYGKEIVTAFIRMNGSTIGAIGNQSRGNDGKLTIAGCEKITDFVNFCDAFNIPVLTITDVAGYAATVEQEKAGISKAIAKMTYAFANATTPKVNVIVGRAYGSAYIAQNSKHIGADMVFAWPNATISMMEPGSAVKIMYADDIAASKVADTLIAEKITEFTNIQASPYAAASRGYVDDVIVPAGTRKRVLAAFEMLLSKSEYTPDKKHGTI